MNRDGIEFERGFKSGDYYYNKKSELTYLTIGYDHFEESFINLNSLLEIEYYDEPDEDDRLIDNLELIAILYGETT